MLDGASSLGRRSGIRRRGMEWPQDSTTAGSGEGCNGAALGAGTGSRQWRSALVSLLLNEGVAAGGEKRTCELAAVEVDHLCGCAEGRQEVLARAAMRLSPASVESTVRAARGG